MVNRYGNIDWICREGAYAEDFDGYELGALFWARQDKRELRSAFTLGNGKRAEGLQVSRLEIQSFIWKIGQNPTKIAIFEPDKDFHKATAITFAIVPWWLPEQFALAKFNPTHSQSWSNLNFHGN